MINEAEIIATVPRSKRMYRLSEAQAIVCGRNTFVLAALSESEPKLFYVQLKNSSVKGWGGDKRTLGSSFQTRVRALPRV